MNGLNFHSVTDIITNSSSVIYTSATNLTVTTLKSALSLLLQQTNSQLDIDDLFDFDLRCNDFGVCHVVVKNKVDNMQMVAVSRVIESIFTTLTNVEIFQG